MQTLQDQYKSISTSKLGKKLRYCFLNKCNVTDAEWSMFKIKITHSFKTNSLFCSVRTCLEIHTKTYNLSKTQVWCFFERCWTIHCSCTTFYCSCKSILSIHIRYNHVWGYISWSLQQLVFNMWHKAFSVIIWYLLYSYTDISSKICKYCAHEPSKKLK